MNRNRKCAFIIIVILSFIFSGCATIPEESVMVSEKVSEMIANIRASHIKFVNKYFEEKKKEIKTVIMTEYKPIFMKNVAAKLKDKKEEFTFEKYDRAMERVMEKMNQSMGEMESLRVETLEEIDNYYYTMMKSNESITLLLSSASKVEKARNKLIERVGVEPEKIIDFSQLDSKMQIIIDKINQGKELVGMEGKNE